MDKKAFIEGMVQEDIGRGDLFAQVSQSKRVQAYIIAKSDGVFAGKAYIDVAIKMYELSALWHIEDGSAFQKGTKLVEIEGDSHTLLSLERTLLNIALHASSIATLTHQYVKVIEGTGVQLLDTRKTRPLLRVFEKYAVRCGGGLNHRMGLDDCLMLKDTHLKTIDDLEVFMQKVRATIPFTTNVEIECETVEMAEKAMVAGANIVMCDNMPLEHIKEVVALRNAGYPSVRIEASGNVTLETIQAIAQTGVDAISSGSIIHQANWIDLSMKVDGAL
jgi:nicotinate-nucleotide pyrophosphorylase (carboxylating)